MERTEGTINQQMGVEKKMPPLEANNNPMPESKGINWETSKRKKEQ